MSNKNNKLSYYQTNSVHKIVDRFKKPDYDFFAIIIICNTRLIFNFLDDLKFLGLDYNNVIDKSSYETNVFLVKNTAYSFKNFQSLTKKINEKYGQTHMCVAKWNIKRQTYYVNVLNKHDGVNYKAVKSFCSKSLLKALKKFSLVFDGENTTLSGNILLSETHTNICVASSHCLMGAYIRRDLLKKYLD